MERDDRQDGSLPDPSPRWGRSVSRRVVLLRPSPLGPRIESELDAPPRAGEAREDERPRGDHPRRE